MSHHGNEYYILVGFCVNKAHMIIFILFACLPLPIHMVILNLLAPDRQEEIPRISQPHNFQEILHLGKQGSWGFSP